MSPNKEVLSVTDILMNINGSRWIWMDKALGFPLSASHCFPLQSLLTWSICSITIFTASSTLHSTPEREAMILCQYSDWPWTLKVGFQCQHRTTTLRKATKSTVFKSLSVKAEKHKNFPLVSSTHSYYSTYSYSYKKSKRWYFTSIEKRPMNLYLDLYSQYLQCIKCDNWCKCLQHSSKYMSCQCEWKYNL